MHLNQKITKARLADAMIRVVALGAVTATALAAPNAVKMFDKPFDKLIALLDDRERCRAISEALSYLGYRNLVSGDGCHGVQITQAGRLRLRSKEICSLHIVKQYKWDGMWRLVIFDVAVSKNSSRAMFVRKLKDMGFGVLQRSVYITPYKCQQEVAKIAEYFGIAKSVIVVETDHIENDFLLRDYFGV